MDIQLYVYDLSKGLARTISAGLLGIQIDAVYHTSIVFGGIEYVYDGGVKTVQPGKTHLGPPMETVELGRTSLPMDVIMDYLDSLRQIYTPEASTLHYSQMQKLTEIRHMISSATTATISPTISLRSWWASLFPSISPIFQRQFSILHSVKCLRRRYKPRLRQGKQRKGACLASTRQMLLQLH